MDEARRYIDQSLKDMDMEKCNPVSTPGLQVTEKDLATEEQVPDVLAGLYRRVTGRLHCVAGQRPDVQQAVKELVRRMSSPTNIHWARLKRAMRYLGNKRTSIWMFEPTANEARDNELTATSDSDWGGCVKTRKSTTGIVLRYAGCMIATISRTQGCISLSSAEAECCGMVSALATAKLSEIVEFFVVSLGLCFGVVFPETFMSTITFGSSIAVWFMKKVSSFIAQCEVLLTW